MPRYRLTIEYDADNAYGTPVRGHSLCQGTVPRGEEFAGFGPLGPAVDGTTRLTWAP